MSDQALSREQIVGVRIDAFAVDPSPFDDFLNHTLAELALLYVRNALDPQVYFSITFHDDGDTHIVVKPGGLISMAWSHGTDRRYSKLDERQLEGLANLQRTAREHVSGPSLFQLRWLLKAF